MDHLCSQSQPEASVLPRCRAENSPRLVTLTGADDTTPIEALHDLSRQFEYVEWGILWHNERHGCGRYPSLSWIDTLVRGFAQGASPHFALHVCGQRSVDDFVAGRGVVTDVAVGFGRVQLNLKAANVDSRALFKSLARGPEQTIITQHNAANLHLWQELRSCKNHAVLFDDSGGNSISPVSWPSPLPGKSCGYAGGLGPDNLPYELPRIAKAAGGHAYWIDMEGKLRNAQDQFDLALATICLHSVDEWLFQAGS